MKRLVLVVFLLAAGDPAADERLARHRNLGKAFFENPTTHPQAVEEFRKALALAPASARERLNFGIALLANGQTPEGIAEIEKVQKQDPAIPHTWFNLAIQYKKAGDYDKALLQMEQFLKLVPTEATAHYNAGTFHKLAGRTPEAIRAFEFARDLDPNLAAPHFQLFNLYRQAGRKDDAARELQLFQKAKDGQANAAIPEDVDWSFYSEILDTIEPPATAVFKPIEAKFATRRIAANTAGFLILDRNGDGRPVVLPYSELGPGIIHAAAADFNNDGFPDVAAITAEGAALYVNTKGRFTRKPLPAAGKFSLAVWLDYDHDYDLDLLLLGQSSVLLRNQGDSGFTDRSSDFPFVKGRPVSAAAFRLIADTKAMDLAVTYSDRPAVLYHDKLAGKYLAESLPATSAILSAADADGDGSIDLLTETHVLLNRNGKFTLKSRESACPAIFADFDNRGVAALFSNAKPAKSYQVADINLDGKLDLVVHRPDGSLDLLTNQTATPYASLRVALAGIKNQKLAPGSEVELKAGRLYRKQVYEGFPLLFGVGTAKQLDAVRITWPNGLIQSEANQAVKPQAYKEAQRLSGSCPQVWTWNGREFEYVTDVLGVAPLGTLLPVDHLEHIQLPSSMKPNAGFYEIRLTEELAEVAYIDQVRLIAVDHPAADDVFINEKFQSPPYPDLKIYRGHGANLHLGPEGQLTATGPLPLRPLLVLTGWVNWADGSEFLKAAQEAGKELKLPKLEFKDDHGQWKTMLEDMGMPAGKTKTIAIELPFAAREMRIVSNLDLHWTQARLLAANAIQPVAELAPTAAELRFRGFSRLLGTNPERFAYSSPQSTSMWNPTPGLYTKYGSVAPLTVASDNKLVVMGSGDELILRFDARQFLPVGENRRRSFVLAVDGWAKDQDANTIDSQSVEPLPFHGAQPASSKWKDEYNTRPALRLVRPLTN